MWQLKMALACSRRVPAGWQYYNLGCAAGAMAALSALSRLRQLAKPKATNAPAGSLRRSYAGLLLPARLAASLTWINSLFAPCCRNRILWPAWLALSGARRGGWSSGARRRRNAEKLKTHLQSHPAATVAKARLAVSLASRPVLQVH